MYVYVCLCVAYVYGSQLTPSTLCVSGIELKLSDFRGKHSHLLSNPTSSLSWVFRPFQAGRQESGGADSSGEILFGLVEFESWKRQYSS